MLKLKLQYFGHLMRRVDSLEKTRMLEGIRGRRRRGRPRMRWLDGIPNSTDMSLGKLGRWWWTGSPGVLQSMGSQTVGHDWVTALNWTELSQIEYVWLEQNFSSHYLSKTLENGVKPLVSWRCVRCHAWAQLFYSKELYTELITALCFNLMCLPKHSFFF